MKLALGLMLMFVVIRADADPQTSSNDVNGIDIEGDAKRDGAKELEMIDTNKDKRASLQELIVFIGARYYHDKPATKVIMEAETKRDAAEMMKELDVDESGDLDLGEIVAQYLQDKGDMSDTDEDEEEEDLEVDDEEEEDEDF